ncbi:MAG: HAMP domain-containing histidine kinase [Oscillospiraceae bacterium]|nr:HAMP domain-containing histidine kinase [Oscillospiraceae bacterium]
MITDKFDALFGLYSEPVLAISGNEFIYYNNAARKFLPDIDQLRPNDIFPAVILDLDSDSFIGELDVAGKRSTFSAARFEGCRIFSVLSSAESVEKIDITAFSALSLEMKNYLAVLRLAANTVLPYVENTGDEQLGMHAAMINRSYFNILRLTSNIELLSAELNAVPPLRRRHFDLADTVRRLVDACSHLIEDDSVNLSFSSAEEKVPISADKDRIEQMLLNMISNSLINLEDGGTVTVSIELTKESVLITVRDSGNGISDEAKANVWSRYEAKRPLTDTKGGAGFGMAVISQIARLHGGSVFFESRKGEGTTIAASIPLDKDDSIHVSDNIGVYQSRGISPFLVGLSTVLGYDKFKQKYMD